jgi:hypothetical protein
VGEENKRLAMTENKLAVRENKGYIAETRKQARPMVRKAGHRQKTKTGSDLKGRLTESLKEGQELDCNCATKRSELPIRLYMTSTA